MQHLARDPISYLTGFFTTWGWWQWMWPWPSTLTASSISRFYCHYRTKQYGYSQLHVSPLAYSSSQSWSPAVVTDSLAWTNNLHVPSSVCMFQKSYTSSSTNYDPVVTEHHYVLSVPLFYLTLLPLPVLKTWYTSFTQCNPVFYHGINRWSNHTYFKT